MTKLLEKGIEAAKALPADRQDLLGEILLWLSGRDEPEYVLTPEQIEDAKLGLAEAERGDIATDEEMAATWKKFGR